MNNNPQINRDVVAYSLVWKMLERVFSQGGNLLVQIVLARILMPEEFGNLAIILAIVNYISIFVQSGLSAALIQKKEIDQLDVNTVFTITFVCNAILYIGTFLFAPYIASFYNNMGLTAPIRVTALAFFLYSFNSIQMGLLSRNMDFKVIFFRSVIAVPVAGAIAIAMAYNGFGLWSLVANLLIGVFLSSIIMAIGTKVPIRFGFSLDRAKKIYSFSIKILGASLIGGFSDMCRTMFIGKKYTVSDLAFYDKAYSYSYLILQIVNSSIQSVLFPVFSRTQEDSSRLKEMTRQSVRITMFGMFPILLGLFVVAKPAIIVLLTEKWLPCVPFLMIFCIFRISGCIVGIDKQVILALGKSSIIFYFELLLLVANVIMLLITIPISVMAIAIGAIIVEYTANIGLIIVSKFLYDYSLKERFLDLAKPFINSCFMMIAMWCVSFIEMNITILLIIQMLLGFAVYIILSKISKDSSYLYIIGYAKDQYKHKKK